ncbi:hypothetical protein HHL14_08475 [Paraburkholderia sp. G-4-1-8]|uniref:Uncharacterized protein n=1 Tax=Paraburkholderia antibiotica TaxID=2728839 RepID=A0A7X9X3N5_9BURK|nr:hypothetical protein [Paraburkholderia antibiotica]
MSDVQFRERLSYPEIKEKIETALWTATNADSGLSARQWPKWLKGNLKNEPNYLRKLAEALYLDTNVSAILDFDASNRSIGLFLRMLDVFAYRSTTAKRESKDARAKRRTAREGLQRLQSVWEVGYWHHMFRLRKHWLVPGDGISDHSLPCAKVPVRLRTGVNLPSMFIKEDPSIMYFYLPPELLSRYEPDAPLTVLQFLLRFLLHIDARTFAPIQTFALDLASASLAMSTLAHWDDENIFFRCTAKRRAFDAVKGLFFSDKRAFDDVVSMIEEDLPWLSDRLNDVSHLPGLLESLRQQFDTALESYGISPRKIRQLYWNAGADSLSGVFGTPEEAARMIGLDLLRTRRSFKPSTIPSSR